MAVTVCELKGSPVNRFDNGTFSSTRHLRVAWADINNFILELLPISTVTGNQIVQSLGAESPYIPGLFVDSFDFGPFFGDSDRILDLTVEPGPWIPAVVPVTYEYAKFIIKYVAPNFYADGTQFPQPQQTDPVLFLEHKITSGGQVLSVDAAPGYWKYIKRLTTDVNVDPNFEAYAEGVDSDVPEGTAIPVLVTTSQHSVHWPKVTKPNWPNLNNYKGHVNSSTFYLGGYAYRPETLMYMNFDREDKVMSNRQPAHDLTLHFEGKEVRNPGTVSTTDITRTVSEVLYRLDELGGHNHFWNKTKNRGHWQHVATDVVGGVATGTPFPLADFNLLFYSG